MSEATYRAAKYIRLSYADNSKNRGDNGEGERKPSESVENQRKQIDHFIEGQPDIVAVTEKIDDGVSGIIFDRKAFKEMMAEIESGHINCIIVKDLSRFGREYIETGRYLRTVLPAYGVRFIAINDNIDTLKDSADDLVVGVKTIVNDAYSRDASVKTRSALYEKRKAGSYVGACPIYGYRRDENDKNHLVIDEHTASVVRDIFRMRIDGLSAQKIAETLNATGVLSPIAYKRDRGLPHPRGGFADKPDAKWSATTIIRILKDENYTGTLVQGRKGTANYKVKDVFDRPEAEWMRTEDAHDAIVSRQEYGVVQRLMRLDTRTSPNKKQVHLFSGLLICGCCGARMTRKTVPYKGKSYHYYYCPTGKKGCADSVMLKESELNDCVLESIKAHISNIASLEIVLADCESQRLAQALVRQYRSQIEENNRQLEKASNFKRTLYQSMVDSLITKKERRDYERRYEAEEARLRNANSILETELEEALAGKSDRLRWMEYFRQFEGLTELDRRTVVSMIQSIRVDGKTALDITFSYHVQYEQALALAHNIAPAREVA